jgi:hypothetical protein
LRDTRTRRTLINGIISAGIAYINGESYLIGETVYCPYSFSLLSGEIVYFKDQPSFNAFLNEINNPGEISILEFHYYSKLTKNKINDKEKRTFYIQYSPSGTGYKPIITTPEKLWGEVPGQQLPPAVGGFCRGNFPEYPGQVLERLPVIRLRRFYQCL